MSILYGNWNLDSLKQYGYFSAKLYLIYKKKVRKRAMIFKRRRGIERCNGNGLISSELRGRLCAQENRSNKFSRNSGI